MSVLSRPQKEWDEFLDRAERSRSQSPIKKMLWLLIPVAIIIGALVCFQYLA